MTSRRQSEHRSLADRRQSLHKAGLWPVGNPRNEWVRTDGHFSSRVPIGLAEAIESVAFLDQPLLEETQLSPQQQLVDKLADMMYASDMILDMFRDERYRVPPHLVAVEPEVRRIYDDINDLMKRLTD